MATNKTPTLQVETERQPAMTFVHCTGQVDTESWAEFSGTIRTLIAEGKPIRVDLAGVTRVDSTGIGAFAGVWAAAKRRDCDLKYINPNKRIEDVIRIAGLNGMLEGYAVEEQKLDALCAAQPSDDKG